MIGYIIFDKKNSLDYGVHVSDTDSQNAPERVYQTETVPGRNGALSYDTKAFSNITISYPAFVYENADTNIQAFRNYLASKNGYKRLEDSFHPEEYRMGRVASSFKVNKTVNGMKGRFTVEFDCKPQRFLKLGEITEEYTDDFIVYNPTLFEAKPLLRVYGNGILSINDIDITIDSPTNYIDIDCDLQDAYFNLQNMNQYITLSGYDFPVLGAGENAIRLGDGIEKVRFTPRWWQI